VEEDGDHIRLTVPAIPAAARITRVGAAGLATRAGFTYREVEQMRLAVSEATALLASQGAGRSTGTADGDRLVVVYALHRDGLDVEVRRHAADGRAPVAVDAAPVPELAALLLDACVDGWEVVPAEGLVALHKRRTHWDDDDE
jgi:hypothetical protein